MCQPLVHTVPECKVNGIACAFQFYCIFGRMHGILCLWYFWKTFENVLGVKRYKSKGVCVKCVFVNFVSTFHRIWNTWQATNSTNKSFGNVFTHIDKCLRGVERKTHESLTCWSFGCLSFVIFTYFLTFVSGEILNYIKLGTHSHTQKKSLLKYCITEIDDRSCH